MAVVARLLRGEPLDVVAREANVSVAKLTEWRDQALAGAAFAFSRERHRLRSPVAPVRQVLVRMLTWPIISAGKSKRPTFTAKAIANYGRDCALPGFAQALAGCAG